jgi:hypothetical protein
MFERLRYIGRMTATPQLPDMTPPAPDIEIFDGAFRFELEDARRLLANVTATVDALERACRNSDDLGMTPVDLLSLVTELTDALRDPENL